MISVVSGEHDSSGIANLEEAVALAKANGIANAVGAIHEDVLYPFMSFTSMVGLGFATEIPGITEGTSYGGLAVDAVNLRKTPPLISELLGNVEARVIEAAADDLPGWQPTSSMSGVRMVSMRRDCDFRPHTDDYEGLVASVQLGIIGRKTMLSFANGIPESTPVSMRDITLFACDSFGEQPRVPHGFNFVGEYAVAFTLGQDPLYTISGNRPLLEENPYYKQAFQAYL